jgi:RimJ/RimL family protein N-acetyltransferase
MITMENDTILTTDRLRLRYQRESDIPFLIDLWSDSGMTRYTGGPRDRDFLLQEFSRAAKNPREEEYDLWVVENRETGEPVGHAGFIPKTVDGTEYIELNYYIGGAQWGKGYATEIASRLLEYAFREKGQDSVIAIIHPDNGESIRVAGKIGMEYWTKELRGEEEKLIYRARRRES